MDKILADKFTLRRCLIGDTAYRHNHKWKWPCTPSTASRQIGVRVRNVVRSSTGDQKRKFGRRENAGPAPQIGVQERIGDPNCVLNLNLTSAGTGAGSCSRRLIKTLMNFMETAVRRRPYIMFVHGRSTSRQGKTTARSVVRKFMRSSEATPYIERRCSIQHETVFVARIKPKRD
jgi:hypothetical protein